jgi:amino acid transporter
VIYAMAERGQLPRWLAGLHPRHRTPHRAIAVSSAIMLVLTLAGTFMSALTMSTIIRLLTYAGTCAALLALRRRSDLEPAHFRASGGRAVALVAIALSGWLVSSSSWVEIRNLALALVVGLSIHALMQRRRAGRA